MTLCRVQCGCEATIRLELFQLTLTISRNTVTVKLDEDEAMTIDRSTNDPVWACAGATLWDARLGLPLIQRWAVSDACRPMGPLTLEELSQFIQESRSQRLKDAAEAFWLSGLVVTGLSVEENIDTIGDAASEAGMGLHIARFREMLSSDVRKIPWRITHALQRIPAGDAVLIIGDVDDSATQNGLCTNTILMRMGVLENYVTVLAATTREEFFLSEDWKKFVGCLKGGIFM